MDIASYESVIRDLAIPPRPEVISVLFEEMSKDNPDLKRVGKVIAGDPGIAAGMLKAANSPYFGLSRKVSSVPQAISVLGLKHVSGIATGLAIRHALKGKGNGESLDRFWNSAEKTAMISAYLARRLRGIAADEAYTYGLFHDCGVPVLIQRFPVYRDALKRSAQNPDVPFNEIEEGETGTSHAILGYFLARSWCLPDDLCQAILLHHDPRAFAESTNDAQRNFIGVGHLAEHIQNRILGVMNDAEWDRFEGVVTHHFGLNEEDVDGLIEGAHQALHGE